MHRSSSAARTHTRKGGKGSSSSIALQQQQRATIRHRSTRRGSLSHPVMMPVEAVHAQQQAFQDKFNKFKKKVAKHKKKNKLKNHRFVWLQEASRLRRQVHALEIDIQKDVQDMMGSGHVSRDDEEVRDMQTERQYANGANRRFWMHMQDDLTELKQMWMFGNELRTGYETKGDRAPSKQKSSREPNELYNAIAMQINAVKARLHETKENLEEEAAQIHEECAYINPQWLDSFAEDPPEGVNTKASLRSASRRRSSLPLLDHLEAARVLEEQLNASARSQEGKDAPFAATEHKHNELVSSPISQSRRLASSPSSSNVASSSPSVSSPSTQDQVAAVQLTSSPSSVLPAATQGDNPDMDDTDGQYAAFWEQKMGLLEDMDQRYDDAMSSLRRDFENLKAKQAEANASLSPWSKHEHDRFKYIFEHYMHKSRALYIDRLKLEFGHRSSEELRNKDLVLQKAKYVREKRKTLTGDWKRQREQFLDDLETEIGVMQQENQRKRRAEEEREVLDARRERLRQELEVLGAQKEDRAAIELAQQKEREAQERAREEKRQHAERLRRMQDQGRLEEYREQQEADARLRVQQQQQQQARIEALRARLMPRHRERVEFRDAQFKDKQLLLQVARERKEIEELEKQARLEALARKVSDTIHVPDDPNRVFQHTESTNPDNWHPSQRPGQKGPKQQPFTMGYGYSDARLMADPRFRLHFELRQKGLHQSAYGRQAVRDAPTLVKPRPDMVSNVFQSK